MRKYEQTHVLSVCQEIHIKAASQGNPPRYLPEFNNKLPFKSPSLYRDGCPSDLKRIIICVTLNRREWPQIGTEFGYRVEQLAGRGRDGKGDTN